VAGIIYSLSGHRGPQCSASPRGLSRNCLAAEDALVLMAIKEYMPDVRGLTDADVLHQLYVEVGRRRIREARS
jgi:hypothetical protein